MKQEKRRFNSYQRPYSYHQIGLFFRQKGYRDFEVINEDGKIIFNADFCKDWEGREIPVRQIRDLTLGQWLDELDYFLYHNKERIK